MSLRIDGTDVADALAALGHTFRVAKRSGDLTPAIGAPPTRGVPGGFGERLTGASASLAPRTIRLDGWLKATTATTLELGRDALIRLCGGGATGTTSALVAIQLVVDGGGNARQWMGYLAASSVIERREPTGLARDAAVTLVFVCPDPRGYAVTATPIGLPTAGAFVSTPLGDVPSAPVVNLGSACFASGGCSIEYVDAAGALRASCTITPPGGAVTGDAGVEVDCGAQSVVHVSAAGVRTARAAWLSAGDFFALDPAHAIGSTMPSIRLTAGAGSASYRKAWR